MFPANAEKLPLCELAFVTSGGLFVSSITQPVKSPASNPSSWINPLSTQSALAAGTSTKHVNANTESAAQINLVFMGLFAFMFFYGNSTVKFLEKILRALKSGGFDVIGVAFRSLY